MKAPGAILALALGKGKGDSSSGLKDPVESPEPDADESSSEAYKSLFVDAAKAGDWEAAFDAVEQCLKAKE
jgi:hypothetical protein